MWKVWGSYTPDQQTWNFKKKNLAFICLLKCVEKKTFHAYLFTNTSLRSLTPSWLQVLSPGLCGKECDSTLRKIAGFLISVVVEFFLALRDPDRHLCRKTRVDALQDCRLQVITTEAEPMRSVYLHCPKTPRKAVAGIWISAAGSLLHAWTSRKSERLVSRSPTWCWMGPCRQIPEAVAVMAVRTFSWKCVYRRQNID